MTIPPFWHYEQSVEEYDKALNNLVDIYGILAICQECGFWELVMSKTHGLAIEILQFYFLSL